MSNNARKRAREHSAEAWEAQREKFAELYSAKRLKLSSVMDIMLREEGFEATERQFKRKIELWGLEKNVKAKEKDVMLRKRALRKAAEGKETRFMLNGKEVGDHKLERYNKRKGLLGDETHMPPSPSTPTNLACYTPVISEPTEDPGVPTSPRSAPYESVSLDGDSKAGTRSLTMTEASLPHEAVNSPRSVANPTNTAMHSNLRVQSIARQVRAKRLGNGDLDTIWRTLAMFTCFIWKEPWEHVAFTMESQAATPEHVLGTTVTPLFCKWCRTVTSTIMMPLSDVLLATLYLYRLRTYHRKLVIAQGSEYRFAVVALMLANKFSEDTSYTARTWGEVSGVELSEIRIMEVEFLSNLRYDMYVSETQWRDWTTEVMQLRAKISMTVEHDPGSLQHPTRVTSSGGGSDYATPSGGLLPVEARNHESRGHMGPPSSPRASVSGAVPARRQPPRLPTRPTTPFIPMSPSMFFSPQIHEFLTPSFMKDLSTTTLAKSSTTDLMANEIAAQNLEWRHIGAAGERKTQRGNMPMAARILESPDWSPVW
ncbi:putative Clr5 domain-containing protein [Seiridium cardinale]|uniref:Clr5 domain-containing protein n=1 Tax=Seiridium cardinale TaxID=138064 RepID=A0ABR2XKG6_9PEZI